MPGALDGAVLEPPVGQRRLLVGAAVGGGVEPPVDAVQRTDRLTGGHLDDVVIGEIVHVGNVVPPVAQPPAPVNSVACGRLNRCSSALWRAMSSVRWA